jgi:hypothetical protein
MLTRLLQIMLWVLLATAVIWTTYPLMSSQQTILRITISRYAVGAALIPLVTAVLIWRSTRKAWQLNSAKSDGQRLLFMLSGALAGFHAGYMTVFILYLFFFSSNNIPLADISFIWQFLSSLLLVMPATWYAAVQTPRRVWRAFHTFPFTISDGLILIILLVFPWIWGFLFAQAAPTLQLYPLLTQAFVFVLGFTVLFWLKKQGQGRIISQNILIGLMGVIWLLFLIPEQNVWAINGLITAVIWLLFAHYTKRLSADLLGASFFLLTIGLSAAAYIWKSAAVGRMILGGGFVVWLAFLRSHLQFHWSLAAIALIWITGFELDAVTDWPAMRIISGVSILSVLLLTGLLWTDRQA